MPQFAAPDGASLHYTDEGHGVALLCLAGLTRDGRAFDYLAPHLPALRLIRLDARGRGRSEWTGAATYSPDTEASDALALLDHLGIDRAALLGTSRGGAVGLHLAARAPERLRGLCLNDVAPVLEATALERIARHIGRIPDARTHAAAAVAMEHAMDDFEGVPPGRWYAEAQRRFVQTDQGLDLCYDPALRAAFLDQLRDGPGLSWEVFDACAGTPVALIRGANSPLVSADTAAEMCARRPDMVFAEVPGRGHVPFLDEPAALRAIHEWLGNCL